MPLLTDGPPAKRTTPRLSYGETGPIRKDSDAAGRSVRAGFRDLPDRRDVDPVVVGNADQEPPDLYLAAAVRVRSEVKLEQFERSGPRRARRCCLGFGVPSAALGSRVLTGSLARLSIQDLSAARVRHPTTRTSAKFGTASGPPFACTRMVSSAPGVSSSAPGRKVVLLQDVGDDVGVRRVAQSWRAPIAASSS